MLMVVMQDTGHVTTITMHHSVDKRLGTCLSYPAIKEIMEICMCICVLMSGVGVNST